MQYSIGPDSIPAPEEGWMKKKCFIERFMGMNMLPNALQNVFVQETRGTFEIDGQIFVGVERMAQDDLKIGEQLSRDLKEAVESMDFSKLNETVSDTVNLTLRETKERMERKTQEFGRNRGPAPSQRRNTREGRMAAERDPWTEHLRPRDEIQPVNRSAGEHFGEQQRAQNTETARKNTGRRQNAEARQSGQNAGQSTENRGNSQNSRQGRMDAQETRKRKLPPKAKSIVRTRPQGRAAGVLCTVFGGMGLAGCICVTLLAIMGVAIAQPNFAVGASLIGFFVVLTAAFALLMGVGIHYNGKNSRLALYARYMKEKEFITFKELAGKTGKTEEFLAKDIKKMLSCGMFPGSRMDEEQTCLMFTDEAYRQYQEAKQAYAIRQEEEKRLALIQEEEEKALSDSAELKAMIERGDELLRKIREVNEGIPGAEISRKINNLETIIRQIFKAVRENPDEIDEMDKFMEYYLPTTVKLLETYRRFDQVASPGENVLSAKQEIEKTLDTIERAFVSLLDDLYQNSAFDAEADAAVLKTMLEQEGLVKQ